MARLMWKSLFNLRCFASLSDAAHLPAHKSDVFNYDIKVAGGPLPGGSVYFLSKAEERARTHALARECRLGSPSEHLRIQSSQARPARCAFGSRARRSQPCLECQNAEPRADCAAAAFGNEPLMAA